MSYVLHSMRLLLKGAAQYRSSFWMQTLAQLVMTGGELLAVLVLMDRFTALGRWQPAEILMFFGVMQLVFALTEFLGRGISSFGGFVQAGRFDTVLTRPRGTLLQVACSQLDPRRLGSIAVGLAALLLADRQLNVVWSAENLLMLVLALLGSFALCLGLFLLEAVLCFFSVRSLEMVNVLTYGGRQTCQYPVDVYPKPLKLLFTFVAPFALCMHLPLSHILGKPIFDVAIGWIYAAPLSGVAFLAIMGCAWRIGVRHYRSTGT